MPTTIPNSSFFYITDLEFQDYGWVISMSLELKLAPTTLPKARFGVSTSKKSNTFKNTPNLLNQMADTLRLRAWRYLGAM